ncbi:unnamed protein product [Plutella xylostella]|uniref:(diamondback moth) hypothetical protein n=1 Tax=Plutella xylostella TaxID=51655 RepID=A0A8S4FRD3_PLUXY|nr:unnamed protein product [Plutella xylostella]
MSIDTLLRFIEPYDGDRDNLSSWIEKCDRAFQLASDSQERILFAYVQNKLTDKAQSTCSNTVFSEWKDLKEFLKARFGNRKHQTHLLIELQNCKQTYQENVAQYIARLESCLKRLLSTIKQSNSDPLLLPGQIDSTNQLALHSFLLGINPKLSQVLRSREPRDLNEAFNMALEEEKFSLLESTRNENPRNKYCNICHRNGHTAAFCRNNAQTNRSNPNINRNPNHRPLFHLNEMSYCKCCNKQYDPREIHPIRFLYNNRTNYNNPDVTNRNYQNNPVPFRRPSTEQSNGFNNNRNMPQNRNVRMEQNNSRNNQNYREPYLTRSFTRRNTVELSPVEVEHLNEEELSDGANQMSLEEIQAHENH